MKKTIAFLIAGGISFTTVLLSALPASANGNNGTSTSARDLHPHSFDANSSLQGNQNQTQHNSTNLDSASFVNQNVTQNVGAAAVTRFPGGLVCPKPMLMMNANYVDSSADWYDYNTGSNAFSAGVSFIVPFGTGRCNDYADRLYERQVFKNEAELVNICASLISNSVALNPEQFPTLAESCRGVQVRRSEVAPPAPTPEPQVAPPEAQPEPPIIRRTRG